MDGTGFDGLECARKQRLRARYGTALGCDTGATMKYTAGMTTITGTKLEARLGLGARGFEDERGTSAPGRPSWGGPLRWTS